MVLCQDFLLDDINLFNIRNLSRDLNIEILEYFKNKKTQLVFKICHYEYSKMLKIKKMSIYFMLKKIYTDFKNKENNFSIVTKNDFLYHKSEKEKVEIFDNLKLLFFNNQNKLSSTKKISFSFYYDFHVFDMLKNIVFLEIKKLETNLDINGENFPVIQKIVISSSKKRYITLRDLTLDSLKISGVFLNVFLSYVNNICSLKDVNLFDITLDDDDFEESPISTFLFNSKICSFINVTSTNRFILQKTERVTYFRSFISLIFDCELKNYCHYSEFDLKVRLYNIISFGLSNILEFEAVQQQINDGDNEIIIKSNKISTQSLVKCDKDFLNEIEFVSYYNKYYMTGYFVNLTVIRFFNVQGSGFDLSNVSNIKKIFIKKSNITNILLPKKKLIIFVEESNIINLFLYKPRISNYKKNFNGGCYNLKMVDIEGFLNNDSLEKITDYISNNNVQNRITFDFFETYNILTNSIEK